MNETNDTATRSARSGKTLSLKKTETSTVKQSFSHGRTKAVLVEKKACSRDTRRCAGTFREAQGRRRIGNESVAGRRCACGPRAGHPAAC